MLIVINNVRTIRKCINCDSYKVSLSISLYSLQYAGACNELAGPISASLRPGNTAPFEEMSQRWRAVSNTVSDLTGPRFEPQTSRSRDERVTARPIGRFSYKVIITKIKQGTAFSTYKFYFIATKPSKLRL